MGIYEIQNSLLPGIHHQASPRNQNGAGTIEITIDEIEVRVIGRCKPIQYLEVGVKLEKALAEVRPAVPASIPGDKVDVSVCVYGGSLPKLPDTCAWPGAKY